MTVIWLCKVCTLKGLDDGLLSVAHLIDEFVAAVVRSNCAVLSGEGGGNRGESDGETENVDHVGDFDEKKFVF